MNTLECYGWNNYKKHYPQNSKVDFEIGRIISLKGFKYILITNIGELEAEVSGKLLYGSETESLPKVGDWVFFMRYDTIGYIIDVLPRVNELSRKSPGTKAGKQVLAANIDCALVVQGLDRDFNIMRLERYLVQILACNIKPVIVLNKADLVDNPDQYKQEVTRLGRNIPVYFSVAYNQTGIAELKNAVLEPDKTYILIGSSGVGKSSLLNALMDNPVNETGDLSDATGKGRHTTTSRELFQLPNGCLIIDTPGMREFGIAFVEAQYTDDHFPLIEKLAGTCRYSDCRHLEEDGCAVLRAYETGNLDAAVYESYLKLVKEQRHFEVKIEDRKRLGKQFGKMVREVRDYRKKYKY